MIDDSVITSDGIINVVRSESTKTMKINFNDKKATCKMDNFLFGVLLITILLLITVGIYY